MNVKVAIVVTAFLAGMGFMIISSSEEESHPHYQLTEFYNKLEQNPGKIDGMYMTLYGDVKEGSIVRNGVEAEFLIEKEGLEMAVFYTGKNLLPDTFQDGAEVSLDGRYNAEEGRFVADKALAKCASKYQSADMAAEMKAPQGE